jgi:hypothetical protein
MRFLVKRLAPGFVLIALASAVLLLSDLGRRTAAARTVPHIGLLQHASTSLLDEGTRGAIAALNENGFVEGKTVDIDKFNAHGDISVGNSIANQMVNARYDLLLTIDLGKTVFHLVGVNCAARLWCVRSFHASNCCISRRTCRSNDWHANASSKPCSAAAAIVSRCCLTPT